MGKLLLKSYCLLIIVIFSQSLTAQDQSNDTISRILKVDLKDSLFADYSYIVKNDTISYISQEDSLSVTGEIITINLPDTVKKFHSPHRASIFAAVIPGLGQIYNKKYWKIPFLLGGIGGVAYAVSFNSERYSYYRNAYRDFIIRDPANKSYLEIIEGTFITEELIYNEYQQWFRDYLNNSKKRFKRYRDISYASVVAFYLISVIDATIDAHFYYFDVSEDLSLLIEPTYINLNGDLGGVLGLNLKLTF